MILFYLISALALLPCLFCQPNTRLGLCDGKTCPAGEECRIIKPCGRNQRCNLTSICTKPVVQLGGCFYGVPILHTNNKTAEELVCYPGAPCPNGTFCSTAIADASSVCCPSSADKTPKPGRCPTSAAIPDRYWNLDQCINDNDCIWDEKCCLEGPAKICVPPEANNTVTTGDIIPLPVYPPLLLPGDPCATKECPPNQKCRHFKPCGPQEQCNATAICTSTKSAFEGQCLLGDPVLFRDNNGVYDTLTCHTKAPCPKNAFCSTALADAPAFCCLSSPISTVKSGTCPVAKFDPGRFWCVDGCQNDSDCPWDEKCCFTGCSKECVRPAETPTEPTPPPTLIPIAPAPANVDPCANKICPPNQECRHFKSCGILGRCNITSTCHDIDTNTPKSCPMQKLPILVIKNGQRDYLTCHNRAPCPNKAFCKPGASDQHLAACCSTNPVLVSKNGDCPAPKFDPQRGWCADSCWQDGDCDGIQKCCFTGCSKECVAPARPKALPVDPCDFKKCPASMYCRRRGQPCRDALICMAEGKCTPCPRVFPALGEQVINDPDGCPAIIASPPLPHESFPRRRPFPIPDPMGGPFAAAATYKQLPEGRQQLPTASKNRQPFISDRMGDIMFAGPGNNRVPDARGGQLTGSRQSRQRNFSPLTWMLLNDLFNKKK